jgi:nucleotide-binding universal stress UspA family protein
MVPFRTILCPTDFSDCAGEAFRLACSLAEVHGARLVVAHVIDVLHGEEGSGGVMVQVRLPDYPRRMREALERQVPTNPDLPVEHVLAEGRPADEILRLAKATRCDLLVMGTHGRTGLRRMLLGSVAEQVLRRAPCPVLTVRPAHEPSLPIEVAAGQTGAGEA